MVPTFTKAGIKLTDPQWQDIAFLLYTLTLPTNRLIARDAVRIALMAPKYLRLFLILFLLFSGPFIRGIDVVGWDGE